LIWQATIHGVPRTKKNSAQIVRSGFRPRLIPSAAFRAWNRVAQVQLVSVRPAQPIATGVNCRALFYREALRGDAVGFYQALADALEDAGVVVDDKFIVSWDGSRLLKDAINPRIEVILEAAKF
jgi:hypothetical protein